jgi:tetratricopeptide (TPR) repeat protein
MSMARVWFFRIAMLALVPVLLLAAEAGLRLVGYGHRTSFFLETQIGSRPVFVENDKFGLRFFPPNQVRSPAPVVMDAVKPANTYRIFLMGESAALGDPDAAYGAGRYLETLLNERFPTTHFEVVCVAMTAINSHAIRSIARECAEHQGDLWIIYMGNNEMVGPFGAATTVSGLHSPPLGLIRLNLALQRTRLGQLFMAAIRRLNGGKASQDAVWEGMKTFADNTVTPNDPRKESVYNNFRANLEDILRAGRDSGAKIILNTVAVNLKDCAPFGSVSATNLPEPARLGFAQTCRIAVTDDNEGHFADAASLFSQAEMVCPKSAELEFLQGRCLLRLTNYPAAAEHFALARDDDTLPFRTDSRINALITQIDRQYSSQDLVFCDAARLIASNSPSGVPGEENFYEHVHFNFDGNYRLALAWAEEAERLLPAALTNGAGPAWASQESCERDLGVTDWNRYFVLEKALARVLAPPFTSQLDHFAKLNQFTNQLVEIKSRLKPDAVEKARSIGRDALQRRPNDHYLLEKSAEVLEATGDLPRAEAEWEKVRDLLPHHFAAYYQVGRLLAEQGKWTAAEPPLLQATAMRPDSGESWLELGEVHAAQDKMSLALQEYAKAGRLLPQNYWVPYHAGRALVKLNRHAEAIADFHRSIALGPKSFWNGHYALGEELAFGGQAADARKEFQEVVRLKPQFAPAHLNLGVALVKQGKLQDAQAEFEEVIRLQPENKAAMYYLSQIHNAKKVP